MWKVVALVLLLPILAAAQTPAPAEPPGIRILQPQAGQKLAQTFVTVRYELLNPNTAGTATFRLRLDDREPVETAFTEHTFTGLKPDTHVLLVEQIDANGTPIHGTRVEVRFVSTQPPPRRQESESPPPRKPRFSSEGKVVFAGLRR